MTQMWRGQVLADGAPKQGVVVSDGQVVVLTDAHGVYALPPTVESSGDNDFLWVCVPSGFSAAGPWFLPARRNAVFRLRRDPYQTPSFSFVFFTDIHLVPNLETQPFAAVLADIESLRPAPAFCVSGGDVEFQAGMGECYCQLLSSFPLPVRHVPGNHDLLVGRDDPWALYRRLCGPARYSWEYGGIHFVVLAAMVPNPAQQGWRNVEGEFTEAELAWLEADLRLAERRPVVAFLHIPPLSTFAQRQGLQPGQEAAWEVRRSEQFLALCDGYNVRLVLSGHFHENERIMRGHTEFLSTGAVCGHWWERGERPAVNLDGTPKGYRVIYVDGECVETVYRATGCRVPPQLQIVTPQPDTPARGRVTIGVNVFDGDSSTRVEARIGEAEWIGLLYTPQQAGSSVFSNAHFWTGYWPDELPAGTHSLTVRATFADGKSCTEQVGLMIENGA